DSSDPIDKILRSFALDLTMNPTFGQILNQARGEKIDITLAQKKDAPPAKISGTIIGMESQRRTTETVVATEVEILNLNTPACKPSRWSKSSRCDFRMQPCKTNSSVPCRCLPVRMTRKRKPSASA